MCVNVVTVMTINKRLFSQICALQPPNFLTADSPAMDFEDDSSDETVERVNEQSHKHLGRVFRQFLVLS